MVFYSCKLSFTVISTTCHNSYANGIDYSAPEKGFVWWWIEWW